MQGSKTIAACAFWAVAAFGGGASAAEFRTFSQADFAQAKAQGAPVLVNVYAWWCPTCRAQEGVLKDAAKNPEFDKMIIYKLDYGGQKNDRLALGVRKQSTLIAFKGAQETGRSTGETDPAKISGLMRSALK